MNRAFAFKITMLFILLSFTKNAGNKKFCARTDSEGLYLPPDQQTQDPKARSRDSPESLRSILEKNDDNKLGEGVFGKVYKVNVLDKKFPDTAKDFAVKEMKNEPANIQEIDTLLSLRNVEGVPRLYECETSTDLILLRQDLLEKDLFDSDNLKYLREMHLDKRLELFIGALKTLGEIHAKGWIHLDIKPENMMFADSNRERIYIIDFGLARKKGIKIFCGTPIFMSPEMILEDRYHEVDEGEDIWSFVMSMIDIEIGDIIKLDDVYMQCLQSVLEYRYSQNARMEECLNVLMFDIENAFKRNESIIGKGCSAEWVGQYQNILLTQIAKSRSNRDTIASLINGLETIIDGCKEDRLHSEGLNEFDLDSPESMIFAKIHNAPLVKAGMTDRRFISPPSVEENRFGKFIGLVTDQISNLLQYFTAARETINPEDVPPAEETIQNYPNASAEPFTKKKLNSNAMVVGVMNKKEPIFINSPQQQAAHSLGANKLLPKGIKGEKKMFAALKKKNTELRQKVDHLLETESQLSKLLKPGKKQKPDHEIDDEYQEFEENNPLNPLPTPDRFKKPMNYKFGALKTDGTKSDPKAPAITAGADYFSPSSQAPATLLTQPKKDGIRI